jgi:hypothetical protein
MLNHAQHLTSHSPELKLVKREAELPQSLELTQPSRSNAPIWSGVSGGVAAAAAVAMVGARVHLTAIRWHVLLSALS